MLSYIPHKENPHSWKTILFVFLVVGISASGAYFAHGFLRSKNEKNIAIVIAAEKNMSEEISASPLMSENKEIFPEQSQEIPEEAVVSPEELFQEVPVLTDSPKDRIAEIKKYAKPLIKEGKYIDISLKYQNMIIFENGQALDAYLISSGKRGFETPTGTFKIENKFPRAWSKAYGLWMPNWMAILPTGKVGIHELPVWPSGYQEGANHLGTPVSHGCVRLGKDSAKRVYDWVEIGIPVVVHK